jgi:hypothetical protein
MTDGEADASPPPRAAPAPLSRHDGHPFEPSRPGGGCALCGESLAHILHHPTRIRAACALRGIDPEPLLARARQAEAPAPAAREPAS